MPACAIRYRLEGPGPAALLVDCGGQLHIYTQGVLGGTMPRSRLLAILAERGCRWVSAGGEVDVDLPADLRSTPRIAGDAAGETLAP